MSNCSTICILVSLQYIKIFCLLLNISMKNNSEFSTNFCLGRADLITVIKDILKNCFNISSNWKCYDLLIFQMRKPRFGEWWSCPAPPSQPLTPLFLSVCYVSPIISPLPLQPSAPHPEPCGQGWKSLGPWALPVDTAYGWMASYKGLRSRPQVSRWTGLSQQTRRCPWNAVSFPAQKWPGHPIPSLGKHL